MMYTNSIIFVRKLTRDNNMFSLDMSNNSDIATPGPDQLASSGSSKEEEQDGEYVEVSCAVK